MCVEMHAGANQQPKNVAGNCQFSDTYVIHSIDSNRVFFHSCSFNAFDFCIDLKHVCYHTVMTYYFVCYNKTIEYAPALLSLFRLNVNLNLRSRLKMIIKCVKFSI